MRVVMYKGQSGMWSWLLHRITGLGILLFLLIHIVDISLLGFGPKVYNEGIALFGLTIVRILSLALIGCFLYQLSIGFDPLRGSFLAPLRLAAAHVSSFARHEWPAYSRR